MTSNLVNQVKNSFLSNHIKVDVDWLTGCLEWIHKENAAISAENAYRKAYEQWLLADVEEASVTCLPERVSQEKKPFSLTGKFALQINFVIDISESVYEQWRRLNDKKLDEPENENEFRMQASLSGRNKRLLKLELTDGLRTVDAIEHRPVACLSTKIVPGCKVLISGPIQCSNGVILLTSANVKILGGEVDTLFVSNAYENMLLKALGKPINLNPRSNYLEVSVVEESQVTKSQNQPAIMASCEQRSAVEVPTPTRSDLDQMIDEDDELLMAIELETLEASRTAGGRPTTQELSELSAPPPPSATSGNDSLSDFVDASLFEDFESAPETHRKPTILDTDYSFKIRGLSLVTIDQFKAAIQQSGIEIGSKSFIFRAKFHQVTEKLSVEKNFWNIKILLTDQWSKEQLKVCVLSEALDKLSGFTARELSEMYKCSKTRPQAKDEIMQVLNTLKEKIKNVDCFIRINYSPELPCPTLVDFIDAAPVLNDILRQKINTEMLQNN
ncbi:recQ-mediated genome instability protein 1-like [Phlebotomus argentipes]|uniref:recQ-mediated genome instability protein 1-like n=1 Tax=Phlebotomus argentipes TaxID=94469 RepID=UPI002892CAFF|nr:recQ-mediated genome instability protein 1-like [Phlebotomus argentipes]